MKKSVFVEYFGDYPLIRVLDFLIEGRDMDYSMTEIAKNSGVGWTAFSEIWPQLSQKPPVIDWWHEIAVFCCMLCGF